MATIRNGNQSVLLVVDVQVAVMKDGWEARRVIANVAQAVERARARRAGAVDAARERGHAA